MAFTLPDLPYPYDALAPHMSRETLEYHHDKHHQAYVTACNNLAKGTEWENKPVEEVVIGTFGKNPGLFNNAAQHFNHSFYWTSMKSHGGGEPAGKVADGIKKAFGDFAAFKKKFSDAATTHFGSGWAWLVQKADGALDVIATHDADSPVAHNIKPILTCDVWEHAYYIDYRNARAKYVEAWWNLVNWDFANSNLK